MSQADAENSRVSPKRPLDSFHLLRDLRQRRSSFQMREHRLVAQKKDCSWGSMDKGRPARAQGGWTGFLPEFARNSVLSVLFLAGVLIAATVVWWLN
jgi:hypothetical protein